MTYEEINEMMAEMGLPYTYHHFAEGEAPQLNNSPKALSRLETYKLTRNAVKG